jgi:hypothetical protein
MTFSMVGMSSRVKGEMMTWVGMSAGGGSSGSLMEKWTLLISRMANPHPRRSVAGKGLSPPAAPTIASMSRVKPSLV